ncbi:MAG: EAL domain-containing protein [Sulfuriferula sp.]|nr:EAL domain-containing protein [Sulfuriferula sp.]
MNQLSDQALPILDAVEDGVFIFALDSLRFSYVNEGAARQTGYDKAELLAMTPLDIKPEFDEAGFRQMLLPLIHGAVRTIRLETVHRTKHAGDIAVEVILQLLAPVQQQASVIVIARNITERRQTDLALKRETSEWTQVMDSFEDAICLLDAKRCLLRANKKFYALMHTEPELSVGKPIAQLMYPSGEPASCPVCRAQEEKMDTVVTMEADHPYNPVPGYPIEMTIKIIRDEAGAASGILISMHDLCHARKIEQELRQSEDRFRSVMSEAPLPMIIHAEDGEVLEINKAWVETTGYVHADIPTIKVWTEKAYGAKAQVMQQSIAMLYATTQRADRGEHKIMCKDGSSRIWHISAAPVGKLADGRRYVVSMALDVTERKAAQAQIEFLAYHDALTQLPNRLLAKDRMEMAIHSADRNQTKSALLFLDLDNFKTINDSLGHVVGDALLKQVALSLRGCLRDTDMLSRQGGDEFLIVLPDIRDGDAIMIVAEKILESLTHPFDIDHHALSTSLSIGIAVYPNDGADFDTLLKKADTAMYQAKESGRNTYRFHTEQMNANAVDHLQIRNGLRQALEKNEFVLYYQPQISLASGAVIGAEALLRWQHPGMGMVLPGRFISVAEDCGLIVPIGDWVLQEACRQAVIWQQAGLPELVIAVNLSAVQCKRGDLEQSVTRALTESGLDPAYLELELTESILIQDAEKVLGKVRRLKSLGIKLAIDDFGTGYSSLSYLKRFDVDKLKIDQSFIRDMADDPNDAAIVRAIIQMARSLNLKTIAEGVEDERQLSLLHLQHCDEIQGYYFARPMPANEFARYLTANL